MYGTLRRMSNIPSSTQSITVLQIRGQQFRWRLLNQQINSTQITQDEPTNISAQHRTQCSPSTARRRI